MFICWLDSSYHVAIKSGLAYRCWIWQTVEIRDSRLRWIRIEGPKPLSVMADRSYSVGITTGTVCYPLRPTEIVVRRGFPIIYSSKLYLCRGFCLSNRRSIVFIVGFDRCFPNQIAGQSFLLLVLTAVFQIIR